MSYNSTILYDPINLLCTPTAEQVQSLNTWLKHFQGQGYSLFTFTIRYNHAELCTLIDDMTRAFNDFYKTNMLQKYIFNDKNWSRKHGGLQPYIWVCIDGHAPDKTRNDVDDSFTKHELTEFFHHHGVIATKPEHTELMNQLVGCNTLCRFSKDIRTSEFQPLTQLDWIVDAAQFSKRHGFRSTTYGPVNSRRFAGFLPSIFADFWLTVKTNPFWL